MVSITAKNDEVVGDIWRKDNYCVVVTDLGCYYRIGAGSLENGFGR